MKNQPNEMVTLEWLLPLFEQQLSKVADGWHIDTYADYEQIKQHYHQLSGTLTMANLHRLATLANKLSLLAEVVSQGTLSADQCRMGLFAHQLLQYELSQYVQTGSYHSALLNKTINGLTKALPQINPGSDIEVDSQMISDSDEHLEYSQYINIAIPSSPTSTLLKPQHYQQLALVWRQQIQQLLAINSNDPAILTTLENVSHYLWQDAELQQISFIDTQQRLWYLASLWLSNIANNSLPLPTQYAKLLSDLDHVMQLRCQQAENLDKQPSGDLKSNDTDVNVNENISLYDLEALIADICIQISGLANIDAHTQSTLSQLTQTTDTTMRFLPRVLSHIESIIFGLDEPQKLTVELQQLERQLNQRGWSVYASQVSQILTDVEESMTSDTSFAQIQWQIERQLQELYSAIYNTEQSISSKIGDTASFDLLPSTSDSSNGEAHEMSFVAPSDDALRQLRIAIEDIKHNFNDYVQRQQTYLLPTAYTFAEIGNTFDEMGLNVVRQVSDKLGVIFTQLETHKVENLSWKITQALAESLTSIEILLDCLAQQVLDQHLLQHASERIELAYALVSDLIAMPDVIIDVYRPTKPTAIDVVRYDDSGEMIPVDMDVDSEETYEDETTTEMDVVEIENSDSEALQAAQLLTKSDVFDIDEDIREIFIEEAEEVIADLEDFIPIWQQDSQDLTPLMEVRRGFHTLKGSGRMVGAFSISETAWSIENLLNRVLDKTLLVTDDVVTLVVQAPKRLAVLVEDFKALQSPSIDPAITILQSNNLLTGQPLSYGLTELEATESSALSESVYVSDSVETQLESDIHSDVRTVDTMAKNSGLSIQNIVPYVYDLEIPEDLEDFVEQVLPLPTDAQDTDIDIKEIFIEEAQEVLTDIMPRYQKWRTAPTDLTELAEVRRGFHTLKGSGRMVGANYTAELAWSIEEMLNRILDHSITVFGDIIQLIDDVIAVYPNLIDTFANDDDSSLAYPAIISLWIAYARAYSKKDDEAVVGYCEIRTQWLANIQQVAYVNNDIATVTESDDADNKNEDIKNTDSILETIYSVNEIMAETPVVVIPQSDEERVFFEIFVEEAQTLLQDINDFVSTHHNEEHIEVTDEIVRAFHTLRAASGSSALVAISDVSATIERSLEQLQQSDTAMTPQHLQALSQSVALINGYLDGSEEQILLNESLEDEESQSKQDLVSLQEMLGESDSTMLVTDSKMKVAQLLESDIDDLLDAQWMLNEVLQDENTEQLHTYIQKLITQIKQLTDQTTELPKFAIILDALGSAYRYLETDIKVARDLNVQTVLLAGHTQLIGLFDALAGSMSPKIDTQVIEDLKAIIDYDSSDDDSSADMVDNSKSATMIESKQTEKLVVEAIDTDIELLEIFLEEAQELDSIIAQTFSEWRADIDNVNVLKVLQRHLHTIKGGARMAGIRSIGDLTHEAESVYEAFVEKRLLPTLQWLTIMQTVQDTLSLQIDYVVRYQESFFTHELIDQLRHFESCDELPDAITLILPVLQNRMSDDLDEDNVDRNKNAEQTIETISLDKLVTQSWADGLPDPDILEVFLEEADEIIVNSNKYLQLFLSNTSDVDALQALQRDLHTIKGGARMVAANGIADLAHEMETVYEDLAVRRRPATKTVSQLLMACHDWLADAIFILKQQVNPPTPIEMIDALKQFSKNPDTLKQVPSESLQAQRDLILAAKNQKETGRIVENINDMPSMTGSFGQQEQNVASNEMIRISGSLIEHMINLSGESAINRARIDMGMSSLTTSIEEMSTTVQRLADQLRRMEAELEAQILAQIDDYELTSNEGFDPLEMDQYSSLNQLSKSLAESASDLVEINSTLLEKTRDSESLLLQLSRTQAELQDGLMNSRMVPFTRLTPRLERIVRQTANELNKSVELTIVNADDEMDRTILERITSPLEHMLRNAVDHGIEDTQTRLAAGKDRSGHITLEVMREGSEIVINLTDDGRGINVDEVRNKAISQGLIDPTDDSLSDVDVMQYIFNAGLTTTKQVTQISGRGVGMDVVISEIRQLGGVVSVTSEAGQGSRFTIRVPLTVAVSEALVVRAADRYYAIPLVQIERIIRINPEKLYDYYQSGTATLSIEDEEYRVRYLNEILSGNKLNELVVNTNTSLPLIIVKTRTGRKLALQVDQIAGSRIEVVVKPLSRQLSYLAGISAATIMGDGSVMLILDLIALMRNAPTLKEVTDKSVPESADIVYRPTILVVDDSVTVRKVTSRILERQGINVLLAKDGIDAMEMLQETTPDLMLLDIEMPRMDGFEVATQVRRNSRLKGIPIIMITSRTGDKHRERAFEIGVNEYMGKPFQENNLLDRIQALLGEKVSLNYDG